MKKVNILRVGISTLQYKELMNKIKHCLIGNRPCFIVTLNPEILLKTYLSKQRDEEFFYILNQANVAVADGFGIKLAGWLSGHNIPRITGADFTQDILALASKQRYRTAIVIPANGLSSKTDIENALNKKFPGLEFKVFNLAGKTYIKNSQKEELKKFQPHILFATLGAPYQEKFIFHNLKTYPSIKLALGVGGSLEFITGKICRAPRILRQVGLEWTWRLYQQPWRIKRIINAVVVFPFHFLKWRLLQPLFYRQNIVCLLYKKENKKYKILVVERNGQKNHWQLPQGGTERENIFKAGSRELREELNTNKFISQAEYKVGFKYKFPNRFQGKNGGYRGQKQDLLIAEFIGQDSDIALNFWDHTGWRWVDALFLPRAVHPIRKQSAQIFLDRFYNYISTNYKNK